MVGQVCLNLSASFLWTMMVMQNEFKFLKRGFFKLLQLILTFHVLLANLSVKLLVYESDLNDQHFGLES